MEKKTLSYVMMKNDKIVVHRLIHISSVLELVDIHNDICKIENVNGVNRELFGNTYKIQEIIDYICKNNEFVEIV